MLEGDLIKELSRLGDEMEKSIDDQEKKGIALADAEKSYQIKLREKALQEKDSGTPVTFISQFIRGDKEVAELRFKRDCAETLYEAAKDKTTNLRQAFKIVNAQATREWSVRGDSDYSVPVDFPE